VEGALSPAPPPAPRAAAVSTVLLARARAPARGTVMAAGAGAWHLAFPGFVASVLARGVPLLPNALGTAAARLDGLPLAPGAPARMDAGGLVAGPHRIALDGVSPWDPHVAPGDPERLDALAGWLAARADPAPPALRAALAARSPDGLARAAADLLGRGPGLTPAGDDVLAGAAAGARARGEPALARALLPPGARARTTALSATLLELAVAGAAPEPVGRLVRDGPDAAALGELDRLGQSTGRAYAAGLAVALGALGRVPADGARVDEPGSRGATRAR
jgi:hypothetical protein